MRAFDGLYPGRQIPTVAGIGCRTTERDVWFRVKDGLVEMRSSRHRHSAVQTPILSGTVSPAGELALRQGSSLDGLTTGSIVGPRLTAADSGGTVARRDGRGVCASRYEAVRDGPAGP